MDDRQRIIVSLTSFPEAIPYAVQAVKSVLEGSLLPYKVVLYLDTEKFPGGEIPQALEDLKSKNPVFEVRFDPAEIRSYKKLIPALRDFPDDVIVTVDDDIYYHTDLLRDLVRLHKRFPDSIIAHRVRHLKLDAPYSEWKKYKWYDFIFRRYHFDYHAMQTGVGGVLYPPHSLDESMLKPEVFMKLAPTNDDIWFWAAAVAKGTYVIPLPDGQRHQHGVGKPGEFSLKTVNLKPGDDRNKTALDNILERYPAIRRRVENGK